MSLRESILEANDRQLIEVKVPEWNCSVFIKTLDGTERAKVESVISNNPHNAIVPLVCATMCDEQGNLLFKYPQEQNIVGTKNAAVLHRIFKKSLEINWMRVEDVEEQEKN